MSYTRGQGSNITSSQNLTYSAFEDIKGEFYKVQYGDLYWNRMIDPASIDTDINMGARSTSYIITDSAGMGAFINASGKNIPTVGVGTGKATVPIEMAAISAVVTLDEARQVEFGYAGINSITRHGEVMREGAERHIERVFFFGNSDLGFDGLIDYPGIPIVAASTKAAGGTTWAVATADEIIDEINNGISLISKNTRQIAYANHVILPTEQYNKLATMRIPATSESLLSYLVKNNVYTANTGLDLRIDAIPYTNDVAVGGALGLGRMIIKVRSVKNDWLPMPETPAMLPPQVVDLDSKLYATYTFGSMHIRYPSQCIYVDGI